MLRCKNCGNESRFYARAIEYHTWIVDGNEHFLEDYDCTDSDKTEVTECEKCGSEDIEEIDNA